LKLPQWCNGPFFTFNSKFIDYTNFSSFDKTFLNPHKSYIYYQTNNIDEFFQKIEFLQGKVKREFLPNGGYYYMLP